MSRARLLLITNTGEITQEFEVDQPNIIIGRSPQSNVIIDNGDVSRAHAQIVTTPNGFFVSDMGSTNGTFLNGAAIKAKQMFQLKSNDQVNLGNVSLMFQIVPDTFPSAETALEPDYKYNQNSQGSTAANFQDEYSYSNSYTEPLIQETPLEHYHKEEHFQGEFPSPNTQTPHPPSLDENFHPYSNVANTGGLNPSFSSSNIPLESIPLEQEKFSSATSSNNSYSNSNFDPSFNTINQPTYIPPLSTTPQNNTTYSQTNVPKASLSEEELKLAMEIFGQENNKSNTQKNETVKWAGWNKSGLFQQKQTTSIPRTEKVSSNEVSEDELFKQVFGNNSASSSFIPSNAFDEPLAGKEINYPTNQATSQGMVITSSSSLQRPVPKEQKALSAPNGEDFLFANSTKEQNYLPDVSSEQPFTDQQFIVDTESYYYPTAKTNSEALFQKENYSYDGKQATEEDPFNALKYSEEDSIFAKFKNTPQPNYSAEELKEKLRRETKHQADAKPDLQTIIKNYALPIGLIVGAAALAVFMYFRNSGLFG